MEARLQQYAQLLLDWNRRVNLTGAQTRGEVDAHIEDAAGLLAVSWDGIERVIDIGSGGGLPGIPLAIHLPEIHFTLLEANTRKSAFLEQAAGRLGLRNVSVAVGRAEELGHDPTLREQFRRAISRAAARPVVLLELALPFVTPGGDLIAEVGELDPATLASASRLLGGDAPRLERTADGRGHLLAVRKIAPSPSEYPRRPGLPSRKPLA